MGSDPINFKGDPSKITIIGEEIDAQFLSDIKGLSLNPEAIANNRDLKIVYTPIHGTGVKIVPDSLRKWGFNNIIHVPEQDIPSGDFPHCGLPPTPEKRLCHGYGHCQGSGKLTPTSLWLPTRTPTVSAA